MPHMNGPTSDGAYKRYGGDRIVAEINAGGARRRGERSRGRNRSALYMRVQHIGTPGVGRNGSARKERQDFGGIKTRPSRIPPLAPEVVERVIALTLAGPPSAASH